MPPKRKNQKRHKKVFDDFRAFCETYFRDKNDPESTFSLDWSDDHLEVIRIIEEARVVDMLAERRWQTEDGRTLRTNIVTIDQGYKKGLVQRVQKSSPYPDFIMPYRGQGIKARHKPISEYDAARNKSASGEVGIIREMCYENAKCVNDEPVILVGDTNSLKTFLHERLQVDNNMSGSIAFCNGADDRIGSVEYNMFFIDHLFAETPLQDEHIESGRKKTVWTNEERKQNHWLDCFAANVAAAELLGAKLGFKRLVDVGPIGKATQKRFKRGFKGVKT